MNQPPFPFNLLRLLTFWLGIGSMELLDYWNTIEVIPLTQKKPIT
jgi:hypothetical protein